MQRGAANSTAPLPTTYPAPSRFQRTQPFAPGAILPSLTTLKKGALSLWLLGAVALSIRLLAGLGGMYLRRRGSEAVTHTPLLSLAEEIQREMGIQGEIALRQTVGKSPVCIPVTWGFRRPVLLLPAPMLSWPGERLRMILLHELAHIRRRDWLTQMLTQLTCTLYWFNPLVWWADARLREECERACDDRVLLAGIAPPNYAETLLEVIQSMKSSHPFSLSALSMARPPMEKRLRSILAARPLHRRQLQRPVSALICLGALACALPLAAFHVSAAPIARKARQPAAEISNVQKTALQQNLPPAFPETPKHALSQASQKPAPSQESDLDVLRKKLDAQEKLLAKSKQENEELRRELQSLRAQQKPTKQGGAAGKAPNKLLAAQREAAETALLNRQKELESARAALDRAEQQYKAGSATADVVLEQRRKLDDVQAQIQALQQQLTQLRSGRALASRELVRSELELQFAMAQGEIQNLEVIVSLLTERQKAGQVAPAELEEARAKLAAAKARIAELKLQLSAPPSR